MMENLAYLIGLAIQFARADRRFPDWAAVALSLGLAILGYWFATPGSSWGDRQMYLGALQWWKDSLATVAVTSMAANQLAAVNPALAQHPLVPVTDSKGGTP